MDYIAVGLAGFFGAVTRALLGKIIIFKETNFPINTLFINLTGSIILSFFLTITLERVEINPKLRLAVATGFLGAYTTFSTFTVETVNLIRKGLIITSATYLLASIFGGLLFARIGVSLSRYIDEYYKRHGIREQNH